MTSEEKNHQVIDLTILLPTYNESLTIEKMLDSIVDVDVLDDYIEVLVIDDNSPDGTSEIVNSYIQKIKKQRDISFKIHTRKDKRGLSSAIIDGINLARGKFVIVMDSDLSHPPETIPDIYRELINNEFDIVIGSRYVKDGMIESWPLSRKLIQNLSFEAIGYKILLEILVKTKGAKVKEIPFVFTNRQEGKSKFKFSLINDYFRLLKILRKNHD